VGRPFFAPDFKTALMKDWEEKIERTAQLTKDATDINMIAGVPTWTIVLFRKLLEITGKENISQIWPSLSVYAHGGVGFAPYREQFQQFIPKADFTYLEIYNASEGFFSLKLYPDDEDMLLLLNNGVYYEFLPMEEWDKDNPEAIPLKEVEIGKNYAMLVSTNAGLWDKALAITCRQMRAILTEYTLAPIYFTKNGKGGHHWLVEFDKMPLSVEKFSKHLDENLQQINSDYEAKRFKNMALEPLKLTVLPAGTFHAWMRSRGKFGVQHKVPRLANHRRYLEEILGFAKENV